MRSVELFAAVSAADRVSTQLLGVRHFVPPDIQIIKHNAQMDRLDYILN